MSIINYHHSFVCVAFFTLSAIVLGCTDCSKKKSPKVLRTHLSDPKTSCRPKIPACCKAHDDWTQACICASDDSIYFAGYGDADPFCPLVSRTTLEKNNLIVDVCEQYDSPFNVIGRKMYVGRIAHLKKGTYWVTVISKDGDEIHGKKKVSINRRIPGSPQVFFNKSRAYGEGHRREPTCYHCDW